jgi:serine/threonine protein kinase
MSLIPGSVLGPYEIIRSIGAGGMGEVYRAKDLRLKREVAIKLLPPIFNSNPEKYKRFQIEAQAVSKLNHPNIVVVFDVGTENRNHFIVSELIEGDSLRKFIGKNALSLKKLLDLSVQIADGLAAAHQAGVVHRDLKPENIMVTTDGRVKILDFGLAKLTVFADEPADLETISQLTKTGEISGTVPYMSPEQAAGRAVDFRTDQFSFGVILHELVSGKRPFDRPTLAQTMAAIIEEEAPPILDSTVAAPLPLRWILERCLQKEPSQRYDSTSDLYKELRSVRDHASQSIASLQSIAVSRPRASVLRWLPFVLLPLALIAGGLFGKSFWKVQAPVLHQLTFRRGSVFVARFAPDNETIYYTASLEGATTGLFSTRLDSPESSPVPIPGVGGDISVSSTGKLAFPNQGILSEVSLAGGAPRQLLDQVTYVDWSPDGKNLLVVHIVNNRFEIECPIGKVLYMAEPHIQLSYPRFSPEGDKIAFIETSGHVATETFSVNVMDLAGHKKVLSSGWNDAYGLAWKPDAKEVWFTARKNTGVLAIQAVDLSGHDRFLFSSPDVLLIQDVLKDGRVLVINQNWPETVMCQPPGESKERNVSWFDYSWGKSLSADGKTLLFDEGGAVFGSFFIRKTDASSPAIRLGDGNSVALSPDGKWAIGQSLNMPGKLILIPTGPGETRVLDNGGIECLDAEWFPDNKRLLIQGSAKGQPRRLFIQDIFKGPPTALTPDGIDYGIVTGDGRAVASQTENGQVVFYPVSGGPAGKLPFPIDPNENLKKWGADGKSLYVTYGERGNNIHAFNADPVIVYRYDLLTGKKELWKQISPADLTGLAGIYPVLLSPESNAYCYSYMRNIGNLFLIENLK